MCSLPWQPIKILFTPLINRTFSNVKPNYFSLNWFNPNNMYNEVYSSSFCIATVITLVVIISLIMFICRRLRVIKYLFKMPNHLQIHFSLVYEGNQGFLAFHLTIKLQPFNPSNVFIKNKLHPTVLPVIQRIKYR